MRFMHLADAHLGYRQYNSDERARDFARAFRQMCERAVVEECDLVLFAGDLIHTMDERTFLQAVDALRPLREEGIDFVIIPGNHDRGRTSGGLNWLHVLQELGLLRLLEVGIEKGELSLEQAIYETDELRVIGIPFVGTALPQVLDQVAQYLALEAMGPRKFTVLMLHAGLEGVIPGFRASLTMEALEPLCPYVNYVALGHVHKPYGHAGRDHRHAWIHNPGSLETVSIDEAQWEHRGAIIVEVEDGKAMDFEWAIPDRRLFVQLTFEVDGYNDPAQLQDSLRDFLLDHAGLLLPENDKVAPVVTVTLKGTLAFDRSALDISAIEQTVRWAFEPLLVRVRDHTETDASEIAVSEDATRVEIEQEVVRGLVSRDAGRKEDADAWTAIVLELRDLALGRSDPERIIEEARGFREALGKGLC